MEQIKDENFSSKWLLLLKLLHKKPEKNQAV